jgi:two-component system, NarL family, sensor kinase
MRKRKKSGPSRKRNEVALLRARVNELEETLQAIHGGRVDALVMSGADGVQVYTLQGAEHPYRLMIESIREGAATLDPEGVVLYANNRLAQLLSVPLEQLIGAPLRDYVPPDQWEKLQPLLQSARRRCSSCEIDFREETGTRRVLRVSFCPFQQPGIDLVCAVVTEVTELVEANEAQRDSEHKLQALSGRLLKLQDEERRHISRDLHDVSGQNLAALNLTVSQLSNMLVRESSPQVHRLIDQCRQLSEQVSQEIRTLSYILHPPLLEEVGLVPAVHWYANGFGKRTGIAVEIDVDPNLIRLSQDAEIALFRILQEALTNVHRYSGSDTARIRLGLSGDTMELAVEDYGKGLSEDLLMTTESSVLLGVGIQGMRERMRQLSGRLEITSRPGVGTKVVAAVSVSAHRRNADETSFSAGDQAGDSPVSQGSGSSRRVLIVDDHEMLREGVRRVLHKEKEWVVCGEASNGKEAIEKARALNPDLVILDLSMPVMNGLDALRHIRQIRPETKVLVFTVNNSDHIVREILAAGADGYLSKADAATDLLATLKSIFDERFPRQEDAREGVNSSAHREKVTAPSGRAGN